MNFYPSKEEFVKLSKKGNLIPVYTEVVADMLTPASAYLKIKDKSCSYLLESVEGEEKIARYSFIANNPSVIIKSRGKTVEKITKEGTQIIEAEKDPLEEIKKILSQYKFVSVPGLPRFCGGMVGYFSYDMVRFFEQLPDKNPDELNLPESYFLLTDTLLIFDHVKHKILIVSNAHIQESPETAYDKAVENIKTLLEKLNRPLSIEIKTSDSKETALDIKSNFSFDEFCDAVKKAKRYIREGDIFQVVLSQRFEIDFDVEQFDIYRALRSINPSPYMFFMDFGEFSLIGASPEIMVRCEDGKVEVRPIAGTRPRGKNEKEDKKFAESLMRSRKERAEHLMLVDLGRNDIGRVSDYGSVKVPEFMIIEKYSHVMHIVSDCVGKLKKGKDSFDVLRAALPAGTVSGSPKIRAMEIIDELENTRRGPYAGCVGYFSFSGNFDSCITIRTIVTKNKQAFIQAGAGIVADSNPAKEYQETQNKAKALVKAIELAKKGF
ncbi:MAG: anthranilate synthase component I [Candidatus Omnitrophota bacterium]